MTHTGHLEVEIGLAEPLEGVFRDPGSILELERLDEFNDTYEYQDGHIERGRSCYAGRTFREWVNPHEYITIPVLEPLTDLSPGLVHIIGRHRT